MWLGKLVNGTKQGGLGYKEVHTAQFHFSTNKMSYHRWRREETVLHQDVSSSC